MRVLSVGRARGAGPGEKGGREGGREGRSCKAGGRRHDGG